MHEWVWVILLSLLLILGGGAATLFRNCGTSMRLSLAYPACAIFWIWTLERFLAFYFSWGRLPLFAVTTLILLLLVEIPFTIYRKAHWIESWRGHTLAAVLSGILIPILPKLTVQFILFFSKLTGPWTTGLCVMAVLIPATIRLANEFVD